jgi:hypothetical protein
LCCYTAPIVPQALLSSESGFDKSAVTGLLQTRDANLNDVQDVLQRLATFTQTEIQNAKLNTEVWNKTVELVKSLRDIAKEKIKIDFGGKVFTTSKTTLSKSKWFGAMESRWQVDEDGAYFIDRNPKFFDAILAYLRTGRWRVRSIPKELQDRFLRDLDYFLLTDEAPEFISGSDF